jgi:hypothetical protein
MKNNCIISSYCSIKDYSVVIDGKKLFASPETGFKEFSSALYSHFSVCYPKFYKMDNLCKLGFLSVEFLLKGKELGNKYPGDQVGIILMNASSCLDTDRHYQHTISDRGNYFPSPAIFVYTLPNVVIGEISIKHKFFGEGNFFIMQKFNPSFLVNYVKSLFKNDVIQCCITGWVEIDGNDFDTTVFLIEKTDSTDVKFANFEPDIVKHIFDTKH